MNSGIIVDTTVWIEFLRNSNSELSNHLKLLLRQGRVIMVGIILAEILQGVKLAKERNRLTDLFKNLPYLEITRSNWEKAGDLESTLRKKGITIPLSDLIIASAAVSGNIEVYTIDPHFRSIPRVRLYHP